MKMISLNPELRAKARQQLQGNWTNPVVVNLIVFALNLGSGMLYCLSGIAQLLINGPLTFGVTKFAIAFSRGENPEAGIVMDGFKNFGKTLGMYLWLALWVILWMLLFFIPGIIKALSYSMSYYILVDNPNIPVREAVNVSKRITAGYKGKVFMLGVSFLGWALLCILFTCGIGFLWLGPYIQISYANFYNELKAETAVSGQYPIAAGPGVAL
jgi:uncharacterized membrane protein